MLANTLCPQRQSDPRFTPVTVRDFVWVADTPLHLEALFNGTSPLYEASPATNPWQLRPCCGRKPLARLLRRCGRRDSRQQRRQENKEEEKAGQQCRQ